MAHFTFKLFTYKSKSISLWKGEGLGVQMRFWRVFLSAGSGKVWTASGLSLCITSATESAPVPCLVAPKPIPHGCRSGYYYFCRFFGYYFRSGIYFRFFGGTSAFPYVWPREGPWWRSFLRDWRPQNGRQHKLTGRRNGIRLANGLAATHVTFWVFRISTSTPLTKMAM